MLPNIGEKPARNQMAVRAVIAGYQWRTSLTASMQSKLVRSVLLSPYFGAVPVQELEDIFGLDIGSK
jgi:hypothetical protein